jgi:hypothetical protein
MEKMEMQKQQIGRGIKAVVLILVIVGLSNIPVFAATPTLQQCDINNDGIINISDFIEMNKYIGTTGTAGWIKSDVDKNGVVQVCDMMFVANHYGETVNAIDNARIQKLSIAYSSVMDEPTNQEFIADHFDMLNCPASYTADAASVKALNPNIKIIGYYDSIMMSTSYSDWSVVSSHEDWFLHDTSGHRVQPSGYPTNYIMKPNTGWSSYFAQRCKTLLTNNPQFDGIFLDGVPTDLYEDGLIFTVPYTKIPTDVTTNWGTWMYNHIQNIKTTIGSHLLFPNAYKHMLYSQGISHVHFWENFIHGRSKAYNENGYGTDGWNYGLLAVDLLHEQAELGNTIAVNSGCADASAHPTQAKQWMLFTYACFSFAVVDLNKAYYSWQFFDSDSTHGYYSEMDMKLGQPVGDYYHVSGTAQVYARQFTNYYVAANMNLLGTGSITFTINGVTKTLAPRTAVFIQK